MYGVGGERELDEHDLDHLTGYDGARPVRIGNGAYEQEQHDVWGALLDSVYLHTRSRDSLDERIWPILERQVETAIERWREPDRGIWEVRGEPKHFTSSKMFCWVACDRGSRLAEVREDWEQVERWRAAADEIKADILEHGVDERGVFVQHYDTTRSTRRCCCMPLLRFLPPDDERIVKTVLAIADELTEDGLVLRYRTEETDDGLQGEEGTFLICSFWLVSAFCEIGEIDRARDLCERLLGLRQPARALRRGDRRPHRPPPRQLPAGVHPPRAHQRGHARDPGRPGARPRQLPVERLALSACLVRCRQDVERSCGSELGAAGTSCLLWVTGQGTAPPLPWPLREGPDGTGSSRGPPFNRPLPHRHGGCRASWAS